MHIKILHNVILKRLFGAEFQRFVLTNPPVDGLLSRVFPAIVVYCFASMKFEDRNV
ncbi:virulence promoting factor [Pantoea agglomerans]|uniref:virulence promoting factor n=1 Tax=Enterobacter agglomerans TaxID=549 RepID=UPI002D7E1A80|nr:virulence promoting factor [Pantoea agglomerans]